MASTIEMSKLKPLVDALANATLDLALNKQTIHWCTDCKMAVDVEEDDGTCDNCGDDTVAVMALIDQVRLQTLYDELKVLRKFLKEA